MNATPRDALDHLSERHFAAIVDVIDKNVGIMLPPSKRIMVEGRLRKRSRALGLDGLGAYGVLLFDKAGLEQELVHLIDCVTTNKTDFFREPAHFDYLRNVAVHELLREHGARAASLKIWSAASSTGAEAYTVAMVLQDMVAGGMDFRFSVLGTDVSTQVLREARQAIYPAAFVDPVPEGMQQRYLMRSRDSRQGKVRITPELRRLVRFEHLNLMDDSYPVDRDVDAIFCRNVLIYFDKPTQARVVSRLASHLRPGGYLILGHSESMAGAGLTGVRQVAPTIYQAPAKAARKVA